MVNASRPEEYYGRVRLTDILVALLLNYKLHELVLGQVSDTQIHTDDHGYACDRWVVKENHNKRERSSGVGGARYDTEELRIGEHTHARTHEQSGTRFSCN